MSFELGDETQGSPRPIACKLYPETSQDAVKLKSSVEVSGDLTVQVVKTGMKRSDGIEHDRYEYNINAYGAFSASPAWDFQKTPVHPEVTGDLVLLMVIAAPSEDADEGEVKVSARVELGDGSMAVPMITRRTADNATSVRFAI